METFRQEYEWWKECLDYVETSCLTDRTTTKENLFEKARNYASNYIITNASTDLIPEELDALCDLIADEISKKIKKMDCVFDNRPRASVFARFKRDSVGKEPENKFIRLR